MKDFWQIALQVMALVFMVQLMGCAGGPPRTVVRTATDEVTDLSGNWNETDSRLTAQSMIQDVLNRPWLGKFSYQKGKPPVVIVGRIRNKSSEHIAMETFVNDIRRELINDGRVEFVASAQQREEVRQEREDQQANASPETAKALANETGADYMLKGSINSIVDRLDGRETKFYQIDLELIDLESNKTVWIGNKKIKKDIQRKRWR